MSGLKVWWLRYRYRIRSRWPLVWKVTMEKAVASRQAHVDANKQLELDRLLDDFRQVVPRLVRCQVQKTEHYSHRLVLDISDDMVYGAFMHGNDKTAIRYFGEHVGRLVSRELYSINFRRPPEFKATNSSHTETKGVF